MKKFNVEIFGIIRDTYQVEALNENDSIDKACNLAGLDEEQSYYGCTYAVSVL